MVLILLYMRAGAGAYAGCAYCCIQGQYSKELNKMVYLDHRSFLPSIDQLRINHKGFPSKKVADNPPLPKTMDYVNDKISQLTKALNAQERKKIVRSSGCTGEYSLSRLPNHDRYISTPVEPMHLLKNISERIVKLLSGYTDTFKVREDEKKRNRFRTSWPQKSNVKGAAVIIPPAPFSLSKHGLDIANQRSLNVRSPSGVDWKPCKLFSKEASRLKSNQWKHVLASGILKFCVKGLLGKAQESTLMELCDVVSTLCSEELNTQNLDGVEYRVHRVLSRMERDFPATIHVITLHLLHHLPMFIRRFGPLYSFWMYPMERFNNWIKNRVQNRRFPEATVMETYRLYELGFFLQITEQLPLGATIDIGEQTTDSEVDVDEDQTDTHASLPGKGFPSHLDTVHLEELKRLYQETYDDSSIDDLSSNITKYRVYTFRDHNRRQTKFGSQQSEHTNAVHISSYVHLKTSSTGNTFGRIQFLFDHTVNDKSHMLACVHWYEDASIDSTSGQVYVNIQTKNVSIPALVYMADLSKPLIHAVDEVDQHILWILNHK